MLVDLVSCGFMAGNLDRIPALERFSARSCELLMRDGWTVDEDGPANDGCVFLGSFAKPTAPDFVATVEFILESGPTVLLCWPPSLPGCSPSGRRGRGWRQASSNCETPPRVSVRMGCETNVSLDIKELFYERGVELPTIVDDRSADEAACRLVEATARYGEPFAREYSSLDAMIRFVEAGRQTTREELFQAIFVAVAMSVAGRDADARAAAARYLSQLTHDDDRRDYQTVIQEILP